MSNINIFFFFFDERHIKGNCDFLLVVWAGIGVCVSYEFPRVE